MKLKLNCIFLLCSFFLLRASQTPKSSKYISLKEASIAITFDNEGQPKSVRPVEDEIKVDPKTPTHQGERYLLDILTEIKKKIHKDNINPKNLTFIKHANGLIEIRKNSVPKNAENSTDSKSLSSTT